MTKMTHLNRVTTRLIVGLAVTLALAVLSSMLPASRATHAGPPDTVTLLVDRPDDVGGLSCTTLGDDDDCDLRSAIQKANGDSSHYYDIGFVADYTITLSSNLPTVSATNVSILGQTTPGDWRVIKINRAAPSDCASGGCQVFVITGTGVKLSHLRVYGSGPGSANIWVAGSAQIIDITQNVIGDDDAAPGGCGQSPYSYDGIYVDSSGGGLAVRAWIYGNVVECNGMSDDVTATPGATGNGIDIAGTDMVWIGVDTSGTAHPNYRNYIRSNAGNGIHVNGLAAANNLIANNYIGLDDTGASAASNGRVGVYMDGLANTTAITGNVISGNAWAGVWLAGAQAITITHNLIGTNAASTAAIANGHDGIAISSSDAQYNLVGGDNAADRNVISGNALCGVRIRDGATDNRVDYNYIGLNADGTAAIPNQEAGVAIIAADHNELGSYGLGQFISGNTREGVYIENSRYTYVGPENQIGVAADETTPLGNGLQGVMLNGAISTTVYAAMIAHNDGAGVAVTGSGATNNTLFPDEVKNNGGLPIDLGNDGFTPNGSHESPGPNNWLNYPVITSSSGQVITGTACANCQVHIYRAIGNPAAKGGGGYNALYHAEANGAGIWTATLPSYLKRLDVSLVACESPCSFTSNTSEMSPRPVVYLPIVIRQ
jgi:hypothetical protein